MRLEHDAIGAEHIVLALTEPGTSGREVLERLGFDVARTRQRLEAGGRRGRPRGESDELAYTSHAKRLIDLATKEARDAGDALSAEHLLLAALLEPRGTLGRMLTELGVTPDRVRAELGRGAAPAARSAASDPRPDSGWSRGHSRVRPARGRAARRAWPTAEPRVGASPGGWSSCSRCRSASCSATSCTRRPSGSSSPPAWACCPLAGYMGEATEHLAHRTGPTIGGLLNATFGNAAELIIAIVALRAGLVELVKASITGSILGNLLLILGLALIAGGTKRSQLKFSRTNAGMSAGMLSLSVVALVFPALFHSVHPEAAARMSELRMSEAVSVILIVTYGLSLLFTLKTHRSLFGGEAHPMDGPVWKPGKAILILAAATVGVAIESELLVHAATEAGEALGFSSVFLGLIIIPIIGNAAEHAAAVMLSRKGQIDLGLQIALGSSTQIALLVAPLLVFAGRHAWART